MDEFNSDEELARRLQESMYLEDDGVRAADQAYRARLIDSDSPEYSPDTAAAIQASKELYKRQLNDEAIVARASAKANIEKIKQEKRALESKGRAISEKHAIFARFIGEIQLFISKLEEVLLYKIDEAAINRKNKEHGKLNKLSFDEIKANINKEIAELKSKHKEELESATENIPKYRNLIEKLTAYVNSSNFEKQYDKYFDKDGELNAFLMDPMFDNNEKDFDYISNYYEGNNNDEGEEYVYEEYGGSKVRKTGKRKNKRQKNTIKKKNSNRKSRTRRY